MKRTSKHQGKAPEEDPERPWAERVNPTRILQMSCLSHLKRFDTTQQFGLTKFRSSGADTREEINDKSREGLEDSYPLPILRQPDLVIIPLLVHPSCCEAHPIKVISDLGTHRPHY